MFILTVIKSLNNHKVKYALVGGYAVSLHGAVRGTVDVDIVIQLTKTAFLNAEKAFTEIGLQSRLPVSAEDVYRFRDEYIKNKNLVAWSFYNPKNPSEILDVIITQDLKGMKTVTKEIAGTKLKLASINDLIHMKRQSNRKQDIEDIKALEKLK